jgi:hypothetical protein
MKKRLSQVHERLFSTLDSSDAEYIFETRVKKGAFGSDGRPESGGHFVPRGDG